MSLKNQHKGGLKKFAKTSKNYQKQYSKCVKLRNNCKTWKKGAKSSCKTTKQQ